VFASALGLTAEDAEEVREALLSAALSGEAVLAQEDEFGKRYVLDFEMKTGAGTATVRSAWIVRRGEDVPRFTSCYVQDLPERGLYTGHVGTVVEILAPGVFEVEFSDDEGRTYASTSLEADQLLALRYEPSGAR
jgi:hypothetical protein